MASCDRHNMSGGETQSKGRKVYCKKTEVDISSEGVKIGNMGMGGALIAGGVCVFPSMTTLFNTSIQKREERVYLKLVSHLDPFISTMLT